MMVDLILLGSNL